MRCLFTGILLTNLVTAFFLANFYLDARTTAVTQQQQQEQVQQDREQREQQKEVALKRNPRLRVQGYTATQTNLLANAYNIASKYGRSTAEAIQGILLQESTAGTSIKVGGMHLPVGKRYYGVMQIKVSAARDVLDGKQSLAQHFFGRSSYRVTDEEIIAQLISDDKFNIVIGTEYFVKYKKDVQTLAEAVLIYNQGPVGAKKYSNPQDVEYVTSVLDHIEYNVRPFNVKFVKGI